MKAIEIKKGDFVKLKDTLIVHHRYGKIDCKLTFLRSMKFEGFREVLYVYSDKTIKLSPKNNGIVYYYTQNMINLKTN